MDGRGLVEVSSEEEPCFSVPGSSSVPFRRWKNGALQPESGVTVEIPFSEALDRHDAIMFPTYYNLYAMHLGDTPSRGHSSAPDIPPWALELFSRPGFEWSSARVRAFADSMLLSLTPDSVESDVQPDDVEPAVEPSRKPQDTKWGRCTSPTCSGRAFRPIMGCKGPFLICSRKQCRNSRSLTLEARILAMQLAWCATQKSTKKAGSVLGQSLQTQALKHVLGMITFVKKEMSASIISLFEELANLESQM